MDGMLSAGKNLSDREQERLKTIRALYEQQKFMYDNKAHSVPDRIVSLSQLYVRPIVRGKARAPVEFGAKLDISVVGGFVRLEKQSFDSYNESTCLQEEIERYKDREGCYPKRVLADKIYRNRANLSYYKKRGIRLSGPALGRPKKGTVVDRKLEYTDICDRVEVERKFSLAKRKCGLGLIMTKLRAPRKIAPCSADIMYTRLTRIMEKTVRLFIKRANLIFLKSVAKMEPISRKGCCKTKVL